MSRRALGVNSRRHCPRSASSAERPRRTTPEGAKQTRCRQIGDARYYRLEPVGSDELGGASIYILLCSDGSYYTGITRRSVEERVSEHAQGLTPGYTYTRRPVKLVFSEHYERIVDAIAAERRIKGWSRAKKEAYMRGDFSALVALSKRGSKVGL